MKTKPIYPTADLTDDEILFISEERKEMCPGFDTMNFLKYKYIQCDTFTGSRGNKTTDDRTFIILNRKDFRKFMGMSKVKEFIISYY